MLRHTLALLALGSLVGAPVRADDTREAHPCMGVWQGVGRNVGSRPWNIEMTVSGIGERCGGIEYDSSELDCGGPFVDCAFESSSGRVVETYTHNDNCAPPAPVVFRCEGDVMQWEWQGIETVRARLRRVRRIEPTGAVSDPREQPTGAATDVPPSNPTPTTNEDRAGEDHPREAEPPPPSPHREGRPADDPARREEASGCGVSGAPTREPMGFAALAMLVASFSVAVRWIRWRRR